jgi:hypothetical protein
VRNRIAASYHHRFDRRAVGPAIGPLLSTVVLAHGAQPAAAQNATCSVRHLAPETALKVATATLEACREQGYQVAVAIVDDIDF